MVVVIIPWDADADLFDAGILLDQYADQLLEALIGHILQPNLVLLDGIAKQVKNRIGEVTLAAGRGGEHTADMGKVPVVHIFGGGTADR